ncbi:MAG: hypothetical protein V3S49_04895 [Thermodesulfobacteriota bacterium]
MVKIKTNEQAREAIANAGITTENITEDMLVMLWHRLSTSLRNSGNYNGTYAMNGPVGDKYMTCKTEQWEEREAVSFNQDGFIDFAGWADISNTKPILSAVEKWLNDLQNLTPVLSRPGTGVE